MDRTVFLLILASVLMSSLAQIVLKAGVSSEAVAQSLAGGFQWSVVPSIASSPPVWLGLGIYFAGAIIWLLVLARVDVSLAYPFVGLGFIVTMLLGSLVHGEVLSAARVGGTLLVAAGVVILARG